MIFGRTVQNLRRIQQLIRVLVKYGFEDIVANTQLKRFVPAERQVNWMIREKVNWEMSRYERVRLLIEELGPTFIKLAQMLSNRPDILPESMIHEFQKLQSNVPPFSVSVVRAIIEEQTGKPLNQTFSYFDDKPLGAASIGQVHRARLFTGEDVVVKVQRPGVRSKVTTDLILLRQFVGLTENFFRNVGILNPVDVVDAFEQSMLDELDYTIEARNVEQFRKMYRDVPNFHIPKAYRELCTRKMLVLEFVSGCKITDMAQLRSWGLDPAEIAERGLNIYFTQMFDKGFFHADPHPGNVLVRPNGDIALIDYGLVGKMVRRQKYAFSGLFISMSQHDARGMATNIRRLALDSDIEDMRAFEHDLDELIEEFLILDVGDADIAALTARLQGIIYKYKIKMPGPIFLLLRSLAILDGIGKTLHPDIQVLDFLRPYGARQIREQYSPENIGLELHNLLSQFASLGYNFPVEFRYILKKLRKGQLYFHIEHHGYQPLLDKIDLLAYRFILSLLISAFVIGSSISMLAHTPNIPTFLGLPYITFFGFAISISLGFLLFVSFLRGGNGRNGH